jgi:tetratricopeptide (TPR) repeat protein
LIELGRSLLLSGQFRGHAELADAAQILHSSLHLPQPPIPLAAALLEYALTHAPADLPFSRKTAVEVALRWFPFCPPLVWLAARWNYEQGRIDEAAGLLQKVLEMGGKKNYDDSISFDQSIFGDETRLNYGVCCAKLGQVKKAINQFKLIEKGSRFYSFAQKNIEQLQDRY